MRELCFVYVIFTARDKLQTTAATRAGAIPCVVSFFACRTPHTQLVYITVAIPRGYVLISFEIGNQHGKLAKCLKRWWKCTRLVRCQIRNEHRNAHGCSSAKWERQWTRVPWVCLSMSISQFTINSVNWCIPKKKSSGFANIWDISTKSPPLFLRCFPRAKSNEPSSF